MKRIEAECISATSDPPLPEMERFSEVSQYHLPALQDSAMSGESKRLPKVVLADVSFILGKFHEKWVLFLPFRTCQ